MEIKAGERDKEKHEFFEIIANGVRNSLKRIPQSS